MNRQVAMLIVALLLTACAAHDGLYQPSCIAYEGDRIELRAGRFDWDRFTDERRIDADGNLVDAFPDFPKSGTYTLRDGRLIFVTSDGVRLDDWFLAEHLGQFYLLTGAQHEAFASTSALPNCALSRTSTKP